MNRHRRPTDEEIVAYLDNELADDQKKSIERELIGDIELQERIAALTVDTNALRGSFERLLENVPTVDLSRLSETRLETGDGKIENDQHSLKNSSIDDSTDNRRNSKRWFSIAAAASLLATVALTSYLLGSQSQSKSDQVADWRIAVADYQRLYVPATLPQEPPDLATQQRMLEHVSELSGLTVTDAMVDLPNLNFKRAQTLGINGQLLVQLAFATHGGEPVALCFTPDAGDKMSPERTRVYEMNSVSWRQNDTGFVLMGRVPKELLDEAAARAVAVF